MKLKVTLFIVAACFMISSCNQTHDETTTPDGYLGKEKQAILNTLNEETKAAFSRDYEGWKQHWIHEPFVAKTYMDYRDSSFSETIGWNHINEFVRSYIEEHPEPDPTPDPIKVINVRLYGSGAWVSYEQVDPGRGLKREIRLMEKVNDQWKIAAMYTTIYGETIPR